MTIKDTIFSSFHKATHSVHESYLDFCAAFKKNGMSSQDRYLREGEIIAGIGEMVLAPQLSFGGAFMVGDAVHAITSAGHKSRYARSHKPHIRITQP